jgi:hypothetical protein
MGAMGSGSRLVVFMCVALGGLFLWNVVINQSLSNQASRLSVAEKRVAELEELLEIPGIASDEASSETDNEVESDTVEVTLEDVLAAHMFLIENLQDSQVFMARWMMAITAELAEQEKLRSQQKATSSDNI